MKQRGSIDRHYFLILTLQVTYSLTNRGEDTNKQQEPQHISPPHYHCFHKDHKDHHHIASALKKGFSSQIADTFSITLVLNQEVFIKGKGVGEYKNNCPYTALIGQGFMNRFTTSVS